MFLSCSFKIGMNMAPNPTISPKIRIRVIIAPRIFLTCNFWLKKFTNGLPKSAIIIAATRYTIKIRTWYSVYNSRAMPMKKDMALKFPWR